MANDPEIRVNQEWIGYVQPVGLVVSPPALAAAQAFPNKNIIPDHTRFLDCVDEVTIPGRDEPVPAITDFPKFCSHVLGWRPKDLAGTPEGGALPSGLEVVLQEYQETLRPTYAVREDEPGPDGERPWMMLIQSLPLATKLDVVPETEDHRWQASPQARFERLLRELHVPIGLLLNGSQIRLAYAPRGETSGHATFNVKDMSEVAGRPIFAALHMLLCEERLFSLGPKERLPAILADSRKYQNLVSTQLAEQVLAALYELVRGFQSADDQRKGNLLRDVLADDPNQVYAGLLTVLMRLVFILYAEDRDLLSSDEIYQKYYAVTGLFERLREDAGRHTDTMDQRYGAWAQLLTLFRIIHDGARHGDMKLLARKGYLFDPDRYPFLEGRAKGSKRLPGERTEPPHVSDGVVFRVLHNLLILGGERLSYRTLDVEQIGSVYETMMGFNLEAARGRSIAIKPKKSHGAPTSINLEELLAQKPNERAKWLKQQTDQEFTSQAATALKEAKTPEDAVAALERKVATAATPRIVPPGAVVLQPSDERRKSGSHYTPRSLTEPIVRTTLGPILARLGPLSTPDQILDLKVCDPAMGSGAFLVETCRQLAEALVKAWAAHPSAAPRQIPPDEDELLHARRLIAQRCLYGVDKNPMAVDLAKLSLWLATLAKDHPFTFLDHALRCGDSLVGLSKDQILGFHWKPEKQRDFARAAIEGQLNKAMEQRKLIREAPDGTSDALLREKLQAADGFLNQGRRYGDLVISAFFAGENDRKRKERLESLADDLAAQRSEYTVERHNRLERAVSELRGGTNAFVPFHWEIEFPEVFDRAKSGFDAFVGNPPFVGGRRIRETHGGGYLDWLISAFEKASGNADLVAFFYRRAFELLRENGTFGLIATNTIGQGDTRSTGLRSICKNGGTIYEATRRKKWPGLAAVVISVVHIQKGTHPGPFLLDERSVPIITAYLFHAGGHDDPVKLQANAAKSFQGSIVLGLGFTFDDTARDGVANPLSLMRDLIAKDQRNAERIFPYIGGEEVNDSPIHAHHRHVINFEDMSEEKARGWPDLWRILEEQVKPDRTRRKANGEYALRSPLPQKWWIYADKRPALYEALRDMDRCLVCSQTSKYFLFAFLPTGMVYTHKTIVFPISASSFLGVIQSRIHTEWSEFFGSSLEDRPVYTSTDCFETFPFPLSYETNPTLEAAGQAYYEFRADLMIRNNEGLTKTYNRFHDPDERSPDILKLRELHAAMDRAVLEAYGWNDLLSGGEWGVGSGEAGKVGSPPCGFYLDYEEDEEEGGEWGVGSGGSGGTGRRRKKPWRYRWPDDFRDEVLARLLELNRQRAEEERLAGRAADASGKKKGKGGKKGSKANSNQPDLFG